MGLLKMLFGSGKNIDNNFNIDLTFGDIVLLWCFEKGRDPDLDYPRHFQDKYSIDAQSRVKDLVVSNYIEKAGIDIVLNTYKVSELKELCAKFNLQQTGKKDALITRLVTCDSLNKSVSSNIFALSPKGKEALEHNIDIIKYHKVSYDIEPSAFSKLLKSYGSYESAVRIHLDNNDKKFRLSKDWGLLRNNKLNKAIYAHNNNNYEEEMINYIEVFYFDLSGYGNSDIREKLKDLMIAPGITSYFPKHKQYYNEYMIEQAINDCKLPKHYFSKQAFKKIIEHVFVNGDLTTLNDILKLRKTSE